MYWILDNNNMCYIIVTLFPQRLKVFDKNDQKM